MTISGFTLQVSEIALNLHERGENITVETITDLLDKENHYDKKTYRLVTQNVYYSLRSLQQYGWGLWHEYLQTAKYRQAFTEKQYYTDSDNVWRDDYFKRIYDMGLFNRTQIENSAIEAQVFSDFIKQLNVKGIIFTIAGKGNNEYRVPTLHDFFVYKFQNMTSTSLVLQNQLTEFTEDGLMLPQGISVPQLRDLSTQMQQSLSYKTEEVLE